jgi:hypothetical protein
MTYGSAMTSTLAHRHQSSCPARFPAPCRAPGATRRAGWLATALVASGLLAGCASGGGLGEDARLEGPTGTGSGFAPNTQVEIVVARARFVEDYEKLFREDLIDDFGVIPIALKLGMKGAGAEHETIYANPLQMDFRLYLEDGTALESVTPAKIADSDRELEDDLNAHALREDDLPAFQAATDKYVFFRLSPRKDFDYSSGRILHQDGSVLRSLSIDRALMSFKLVRAGKDLSFHIGVSRVQRGSD